VDIRLDDLSGAEIARLLEEHLRSMYLNSPPESVHALPLDELRKPGITMWSAWQGRELLGCGALKELDAAHGEIKSMRTATAHLRRGVAAAILEHIIGEARRRAYRRLSLETGSQPVFAPARALYARFGFEPCGPFDAYTDDPNSFFMTRKLQ
jgi:putative acetyltransferase